MNPDLLLTFCQAQATALRETVETLVRLESPSDDKSAVDRCGLEIERHLRAIGGAVERFPQAARGDHLRALFQRKGKGTREKREGQVLLLGHFDTVWPVGSLETMPVREEGGRLHGPGIFDMKSGIAISMLAMRALEEFDLAGGASVVMLWTTDEEIGSGTSRALIEDEARRSRAVFVLEPSLPGGAVKTRRKGVGEYKFWCTALPHTRGSIRARERAPFTSWRGRFLPSKRFRIRTAASR